MQKFFAPNGYLGKTSICHLSKYFIIISAGFIKYFRVWYTFVFQRETILIFNSCLLKSPTYKLLFLLVYY